MYIPSRTSVAIAIAGFEKEKETDPGDPSQATAAAAAAGLIRQGILATVVRTYIHTVLPMYVHHAQARIYAASER